MIKWYTDPVAEQTMEELGIDFAIVRAIPFSQIRLDQGLTNNVRQTALIDDNLESLLAEITEHAEPQLPMPVFWPNMSKGKLVGYEIADGNHRMQSISLADAHKLPTFEGVDAYVMKTDDMALVHLAATVFNGRRGEGHTKDDKLRHAVHQYNTTNMTMKQCAKLHRVKESSLQKAVHVEDVSSTLMSAGDRDSIGLSDTVLESLYALRNSQPVLLKAAKLIRDRNMNTETAKTLVREVKRKKSDNSKLKHLAEMEASVCVVENGKHIKQRLAVRDRLMNRMALLHQVLANHPTAEKCQLTARTDFELARYEFEKIVKTGARIFGEVWDEDEARD